MIAKAPFLQFLTAGTCVAATVGGGYYCFNEGKGGNLDSLNTSNSSDEESSESFPPIFSFDSYEEKIDLKEKVSGLITMATALNKNIDSLNESNLSQLKNTMNSLDGDDSSEGGDNNEGDVSNDDDATSDDEGQQEIDMDNMIDGLNTTLKDLISSDTSVKEEIKKLTKNKDKLIAIFAKIASNKNTQ